MQCLDNLNFVREFGEVHPPVTGAEIDDVLDRACQGDDPLGILPEEFVRELYLHTPFTTRSNDDYISGNNQMDKKPTVDKETTTNNHLGDVSSDVISASGGCRLPVRRRRKSKPRDLTCRVCGDKAKGYNFSAVTCESCKAFFRRNGRKNKLELPDCVFDNNCVINCHTRKFCASCRLAKCFKVQMRKEWILDEKTKQRRKRIGNKRVRKKESVEKKRLEIDRILRDHDDMDMISYNKRPSHMRKSYSSTEYYSSEVLIESPRSIADVLNMVHTFIQRLVRFLKTLPEVSQLSTEENMTLIKGAIWETFMLSCVIQFDPEVDGFTIFERNLNQLKILGMSYMQITFGEELCQKHFNLLSTINSITKGDKSSLVLLLIINLFTSDRAESINKESISIAQEKYVLLLEVYLHSKYCTSWARLMFPKLLHQLTDVREYAVWCAKSAMNMGFDDICLQKLVKDVLDSDETRL